MTCIGLRAPLANTVREAGQGLLAGCLGERHTRGKREARGWRIKGGGIGGGLLNRKPGRTGKEASEKRE